VDSLVSVARTFQENGYCHGDIQPSTCFLSESGDLKLIDDSLMNFNQNGYERMAFSGYKTILSPQLLYAMKKGMHKPSYDPQSNEVWCIGMTTLCVCSYMNYDTFYDYENFQVRYDLIKQNFDYLRKLGYSEQLVKVLQSCLSETEDKRTTLEELEDFLNPMDEENCSYEEISQVKVDNFHGQGSQVICVDANRNRNQENTSVCISPIEVRKLDPVIVSQVHQNYNPLGNVQSLARHEGHIVDCSQETKTYYTSANPSPIRVSQTKPSSTIRVSQTNHNPSSTIRVPHTSYNPLSTGITKL